MFERFQTVSRRVEMRQRVSNYLGGHIHGGEAADKMMKFCNQHSIIISSSFEEYERREMKKPKIVLAGLYRHVHIDHCCTLLLVVSL